MLITRRVAHSGNGRSDRDPAFTASTFRALLSLRHSLRATHCPSLLSRVLVLPLARSMASSSVLVPTGASAAVLKPSDPVPDFAVSVEGPKFDEGMSLQKLLASYTRIGFQANSLGKAIDIVNKMVRFALTPSLRPTSGTIHSANGDCRTNRSRKTSPKNICPRRSVRRPSVTSS